MCISVLSPILMCLVADCQYYYLSIINAEQANLLTLLHWCLRPLSLFCRLQLLAASSFVVFIFCLLHLLSAFTLVGLRFCGLAGIVQMKTFLIPAFHQTEGEMWLSLLIVLLAFAFFRNCGKSQAKTENLIHRGAKKKAMQIGKWHRQTKHQESIKQPKENTEQIINMPLTWTWTRT